MRFNVCLDSSSCHCEERSDAAISRVHQGDRHARLGGLAMTIFSAVACFLILPACQQQGRPRAATSSEVNRLSGKIYFETARSDLSAISKQEIARKAVSLKRHPNVTIILEGHADERGPKEMNLILGDRRARQAKWQFVQEGVAPERIVVVSYGESRPVDPAHDAQAYQSNRRVEIVVR